MLEIGKKQKLLIDKLVEFGAYLSAHQGDRETVLLPRKQVPAGAERGDEVEVFLYRDSKDRIIATTKEPYLTLGQTAVLKVAQTGKIGAFLDWGLEKELLLPFREQTKKVEAGTECLVALYLDKSSRLCATMKVYPYLRQDSPYQKDDTVTGRVYEKSDNFGTFVAVDDKYSGLIQRKEEGAALKPGDLVEARVSAVKPDGKLDLTMRKKAYLQIETDAETILRVLDEYGGVLPYTDRADPETILSDMGMSKNAFKRAAGRLLKEGRIKITDTQIRKGENG